MKRCPQCSRAYNDETLNFCLEDGEWLIPDDEPATAILNGEAATRVHRAPTSSAVADSTAAGPVASNRNSIIAGVFVILLVTALGIGSYWFYGKRGEEQVDSIAVLPFQNRSGDPDTDYLSDGLADSLIYRLSQLPGLKVSPTSSVIRYKGKEEAIGEISRELDVDAVLSGRLIQRGDDLSISVQLVDARSEKVLWAEQYDRRMSDLLATQREIATTIADKLQLKLVGDQAKGITKKYTNSNEAYDLYMRARHHFAKRTKTDRLRAAEYYRQAIVKDPNFALAYARLAELYLNWPSHAYTGSNESVTGGKAAVQKALELDPTLSEAHAFNAFVLAGNEWRWTEAESEFKRAINLDPNSSAAHFRYGQIYLLPRGRFDEGIAELKTALDLEPFDIVIGATYAWAHLLKGENEKALELAKKTYDLEPDHPIAQHFMTMAFNANGMYDDAIAIGENALRSDPTSEFMLQNLGIAYARSGRRDKGVEIIKRFDELGEAKQFARYGQAAVYVALGNRDEAFALLERAYKDRDWILIRLKVDPQFAELRDDPRYKDLLKRLGLSE